jgi:hypothetical protein
MIRDKAFVLAAVLAAMLSVGGALAIVEAQQPLGGPAPTTASPKKAAPRDPRGKAMTPPAGAMGMPAGATGRGKANTMSPMPGMGSMEMGPGMGGMSAPVDDDPEMAELAQSEALLAGEASDLIGQYQESENAAERKQIAAELRQALAKQFDVQKQRRELELARIEERVRRLRDQIKKRDDARDTIIDRRLAQLIDDAEGLGWTPPAGETRRGKAKAPPAAGAAAPKR